MTNPAPHQRPYDSILQLVGWTPLIRLGRIAEGITTPVYGKAEFLNPGGSVKDRIGLAMIEAAEAAGTLNPGGTVVEGTAGNTGIALALAASTRGYRCIFVLPDKMSQEKVKMLRAFGAEVVITPTAVGPDHPDHYVNRARRIAEETPGAVLADQFCNDANPQAHYDTTGPELWEQTEGRITHFLAGAGTGGTITGVARYLKEKNPSIKIIGVDPVGSAISEIYHTGSAGESRPYQVEGLGNDKISETLDLSLVDDYVTISDGDAFRMARQLVAQEGLFVGGSSGLIVHAALDVARGINDPDALVVAMLCDWGEHYLTKQFDDEWMRSNGFLSEARRSVMEVVNAKEDAPASLMTVAPSTSLRMALSTMSTHNVSQLPVVVEGECVGSVGERELLSAVIETPDVLDNAVEPIMDPPYPVVDRDADWDAASRLLTQGNQAVLIRSEGALDGIVTRHDLVQALAST